MIIAEVAIPRHLFADILRLIAQLRASTEGPKALSRQDFSAPGSRCTPFGGS
jgi:hypothetical protein